MKIIGTIEARMGSSRLPGKTLLAVYKDVTLLECVVRRFRACLTLDDVVVATSVNSRDDPIEEWCEKNRVAMFRGSEEDVLDRVVGAAQRFGAEVIVQMGGDSAYLDFHLIDQLVEHYRSGEFDYVCNDLELTYPVGIYAHVVRVEKLVEANRRNELTNRERSDVVRYIWEHPEAHAISNVMAPAQFNFPDLRLTVDYPEDLEQARHVYAHFDNPLFTTAQIVGLYKEQPDLFRKTRNLVQQSAPFLANNR